MARSAKTIEANIRRVTRELEEIDRFFYRQNEHGDRDLYAGMLERKRDDIVRSVVLQLHTSIEDLINSDLAARITGSRRKGRSKRALALHKMLRGAGSLGFDMKLNFAEVVGVLRPATSAKLRELNGLRNRCSHNWLLGVTIRRGKKPRAAKPPLLRFRGRDLHKVDVLRDFSAEYGTLYYRLFLRHLDHIDL